MRAIHWCIFLGLFLLSCKNEEHHEPDHSEGQQVELKYTKLFTISKHTEYTKIVLKNPWNLEKTYATYALVSKDKEVPSNLPENSILVRTPVDNLVTLASPHIGLFSALGAEDRITAVGQTQYVFNEKLQEKIKQNKIDEVGIDQNLNIELLIDLEPDLVMATGNQQIHDNLKLASKYGIPIVYIIEWQEHSPLSRAEWIKYAGAFLEKEAEADSIFSEIENAYLNMAELTKTVTTKPEVVLSKKFKGTWYMAGGGSYIAKYLNDAGADYYWKNDTTTGSLPLSFEEVIDKQMDADIWLNPSQALSLSEIIEEDERHLHFKALKNKEVYNFSKQISSNGANGYWENGFLNPHLVLADMIKIFHPELVPNHEFEYYEKLQD